MDDSTSLKPQTILDDDDFEMDDILTEFAEEENKNSAQLSDSEDELDSLLEEFATAQSESDDERKKSTVKVILSSDDDEIDDLLDDFEDDNSPKCNTVSEEIVTRDTDNGTLRNKSVIFRDKDTENGMCYDTSLEIEENTESLDDMQDIGDSPEENKNKCQSEPVQEISSSNVSNNLSESHLTTTNLSNKHIITDNSELQSVSVQKTFDDKISVPSDTSVPSNDGELGSKSIVNSLDKNSDNSISSDTNVLQVDPKKIIQSSDLVEENQSELETEKKGKDPILRTLLGIPNCNKSLDSNETSSDGNFKTVNAPSSSVENIKVLNVLSLRDTDICNITDIPTSNIHMKNDMGVNWVSKKARTDMPNECHSDFITKSGITVRVSDIIKASILKALPSVVDEISSLCSQETISNLTGNLPQSYDSNKDNILTEIKRKSGLSEKKTSNTDEDTAAFEMPDASDRSLPDSTVITVEKENCLTVAEKSNESKVKLKKIKLVGKSADLSKDSFKINDNDSSKNDESNLVESTDSSSFVSSTSTSESLNTLAIKLVDVKGNTEVCNGIEGSLLDATENTQSKNKNTESFNCHDYKSSSTEIRKRKFETETETTRKKKRETSAELVCSTKNKITASSRDKIKEIIPWNPLEKISVSSKVLDKVAVYILRKVIDQNFHEQILEAEATIKQLEENKEKLDEEIEYYRSACKETSSSLKTLYNEKSYKKVSRRNKAVSVYVLGINKQKNEENAGTNEMKRTLPAEKQADKKEKENSSDVSGDKTSKKIGSCNLPLLVTSSCTSSSTQETVPSVVKATPTPKILLDSSNKLQNQKNEVLVNGIAKENEEQNGSTRQFPVDPNVLLPFSKFLQLLPARAKAPSPSPLQAVSSSVMPARAKASSPSPHQAVSSSAMPAPSNVRPLGSVRPSGTRTRTVFLAPPKSIITSNSPSPGMIPNISAAGLHEILTGATSRVVPVYHSKTNGLPSQQDPAVSMSHIAQSLSKPAVTASSIMQSSCIPPIRMNHNIHISNSVTLSGSSTTVGHSMLPPYRPTGPHFPCYNPVTTSVNTNSSLKSFLTCPNFPSSASSPPVYNPVTTSVNTNSSLISFLTASNFSSSASSSPSHSSSVSQASMSLLSGMAYANSEIHPVNSARNASHECLVSSKQNVTSSSSITETKQNASGHKGLIPAFPEDLPNKISSLTLLPKPELKVKVKDNSKTVMLSWNLTVNHYSIAKYEIYSCHTNNTKKGPAIWKNIGNIKAMKLPMACTLQQFDDKNSYHFIVRAADGSGNVGPFSNLVSVNF